MAIVLDGKVQSAPVIRERIGGGRAVITGSFTLDVGRPRAPAPPEMILQFASDSISSVQVGSTVPDLDLVFSAMVQDADPGDALFLDLEIVPVLANQESRVRRFHEVLNDYLNGNPPGR